MEFKTKQIEDGWKHLHPILTEIAKEMELWLKNHDNTPLIISDSLSTLAQDQRLKRVSSSHREGRAFDIGGVVNWKKSKLQLFAQSFADKYRSFGALSKSGQRTFLLVHDSGHGLHCHVQIGKDIVEKYKNKYPLWTYPVEKKPKEKNDN